MIVHICVYKISIPALFGLKLIQWKHGKERFVKYCVVRLVYIFSTLISFLFFFSSSLLDAPTIIRALGKYTGETTSSSARFCYVKIQMRLCGILRWIEINVAQLIIGRVIIRSVPSGFSFVFVRSFAAVHI